MLRGFLVRLHPVTLRIPSLGTEKEHKSKLASYCFLNCVISTNIFQTKVINWNISEVLALACNFLLTIFWVNFGVQDDGYYLRMMILGCRCWKMTSCSVALLFVCNRLHCWSLLVELKKKTGQNWQGVAFWIALSLLILFTPSYKNGLSQKFSRSLVISHSQFCKFILEFKVMDITCGWWSSVVIVGKWPRVAWLSCSFATGYTADLFSWDWKRK